jgi:hypothetical protein
MRVLTINELPRLTRIELRNLAAKIASELPTLPEGSPESANAVMSLRNVRFVFCAPRLFALGAIRCQRFIDQCRWRRALIFVDVRQKRRRLHLL